MQRLHPKSKSKEAVSKTFFSFFSSPPPNLSNFAQQALSLPFLQRGFLNFWPLSPLPLFSHGFCTSHEEEEEGPPVPLQPISRKKSRRPAEKKKVFFLLLLPLLFLFFLFSVLQGNFKQGPKRVEETDLLLYIFLIAKCWFSRKQCKLSFLVWKFEFAYFLLNFCGEFGAAGGRRPSRCVKSPETRNRTMRK